MRRIHRPSSKNGSADLAWRPGSGTRWRPGRLNYSRSLPAFAPSYIVFWWDCQLKNSIWIESAEHKGGSWKATRLIVMASCALAVRVDRGQGGSPGTCDETCGGTIRPDLRGGQKGCRTETRSLPDSQAGRVEVAPGGLSDNPHACATDGIFRSGWNSRLGLVSAETPEGAA